MNDTHNLAGAPLPQPVLPTSPDAMPWDLTTKDRGWFSRTIHELGYLDEVSIHFAKDHGASEQIGDVVGDWEIDLYRHGLRASVTHPDFEKALWYTTTLLDDTVSKLYAENAAKRAAALAKLTTQDRIVLGLGTRT